MSNHKNKFGLSSQQKKIISNQYLIVCEGETEVNYLKGFKRTLPREKQRVLKIEPLKAKGTDCLNIVREAIEYKKLAKREGNPYTEVWVFFDDDNQPGLINSFSKAHANGIKVAFSCICLEVWFLLHFQSRNLKFSEPSSVITALKKHWENYQKPAFESWDNLSKLFSTACDTAKKLREGISDLDEITNQNPFTNVDLMLHSFLDSEKIKNKKLH